MAVWDSWLESISEHVFLPVLHREPEYFILLQQAMHQRLTELCSMKTQCQETL